VHARQKIHTLNFDLYSGLAICDIILSYDSG
jgi:hypothetical protein